MKIKTLVYQLQLFFRRTLSIALF